MYASRASLDRILVPRGGDARHRPVAEQTIGGHVITELCCDMGRMIVFDASSAARLELTCNRFRTDVGNLETTFQYIIEDQCTVLFFFGILKFTI